MILVPTVHERLARCGTSVYVSGLFVDLLWNARLASRRSRKMSGSEGWWRRRESIAAPIIGGMVTSTIHVLIIAPIIFYIMKRRALRRGTLKESGFAEPTA